MCSRLLKALVIASEKAANIARLIRKDEHLFDLLVQEKQGDSANARFVRDFKTLADVLVQEMVRHDLSQLFPELKENIRGEEESTFTNALGDSITVQIQQDVSATADLLEKVLDNDCEAALLLAEEVHRKDVLVDYDWSEIDQCSSASLPSMSSLGVWIDPIDATAEYIQGKDKCTRHPKIKANGLECVTVLLGVYELSSGAPVLGVINQPFKGPRAKAQAQTAESVGPEETEQEQTIFWGVSLDTGFKANNIKAMTTEQGTSAEGQQPPKKTVALISVNEDRKYVYFLRDKLHYDVVFSAGAGHKLLCLILGHADLLLVSKGTTYLWDTCAPHAILRSMGGNLINLKETLETKKTTDLQYHMSSVKCNFGGILGFRTQSQLIGFSKLL